MKPSKEAEKAAVAERYNRRNDTSIFEACVDRILGAAYAIDVAPLETRIRELEAQLKDYKNAQGLECEVVDQLKAENAQLRKELDSKAELCYNGGQ